MGQDKTLCSRGFSLTVIRVLSLIALIFASALAVDYYFSSNTFCDTRASCDVVAKSEFGQRFGIFLPTIGLLAYTATFFGSFIAANRRKLLYVMNVCIILAAVGALGFIIVQAIMIDAFCWLCIGIDTAAIAMVLPALMLMRMHKVEECVTCKLSPIAWTGLYVIFALGPLSYGAIKPSIQVHPQAAPEAIQKLYQTNKINIVEISSFDCPHCRVLHPELSALLAEYGDKIHFKRLSIPIGRKVDKNTLYADQCAQKYGHGECMADALFNEPTTDMAVLTQYAEACNITAEALHTCMESEETALAVQNVQDIVKEASFRGAPTVWIEQSLVLGFDRNKGMAPYRDAIEQVVPESYVPWLFYVAMSLAGLLLIAGVACSCRRRRKGSTGGCCSGSCADKVDKNRSSGCCGGPKKKDSTKGCCKDQKDEKAADTKEVEEDVSEEAEDGDDVESADTDDEEEDVSEEAKDVESADTDDEEKE